MKINQLDFIHLLKPIIIVTIRAGPKTKENRTQLFMGKGSKYCIPMYLKRNDKKKDIGQIK